MSFPCRSLNERSADGGSPLRRNRSASNGQVGVSQGGAPTIFAIGYPLAINTGCRVRGPDRGIRVSASTTSDTTTLVTRPRPRPDRTRLEFAS
ncbi:hypothetical protein NFA_15630 [Nocardia farcinica IFM 10152]|uniref:Uncharacterized protein n=1 Tax=Nocardia farcinica (strain IFM 10152) TaxID=247156 RepID=Q5YZI2_NOCFA|nr:hypothetical protein NFA_15630 [Nocardia farcinica IFM 10152]